LMWSPSMLVTDPTSVDFAPPHLYLGSLTVGFTRTREPRTIADGSYFFGCPAPAAAPMAALMASRTQRAWKPSSSPGGQMSSGVFPLWFSLVGDAERRGREGKGWEMHGRSERQHKRRTLSLTYRRVGGGTLRPAWHWIRPWSPASARAADPTRRPFAAGRRRMQCAWACRRPCRVG
jgi:hypothetical protein